MLTAAIATFLAVPVLMTRVTEPVEEAATSSLSKDLLEG